MMETDNQKLPSTVDAWKFCFFKSKWNCCLSEEKLATKLPILLHSHLSMQEPSPTLSHSSSWDSIS